ncbi:uncharacterized protein GGS25DRAFT_505421 [Hypoxylon fragiforme]|uniref:uncharacterized protein n=1 Tax=Hypoxylon fragiforme TaxID=63214 RepID=UPI0020C5EF46|nr:uncharacterized protein GGS25DRAFT_505421 [Hypoxylon fragiforme]KAI2603777.1 hypothetical protein GGS25DRAFT_505421 [Hypoxylon fragiforme]
MLVIGALRRTQWTTLRRSVIHFRHPKSHTLPLKQNSQLWGLIDLAAVKVRRSSTTGPAGYAYSERFCLYHAGTPRITFLGYLKLSTIFLFVFFGLVVTPAYYDKEGFSLTVLRTSVTAIAPLIFVQYSTSPFVSCIHVRLPGIARRSEEALRRYLQGLSADAELAITTTSLIAKPRVSYVRLRDLQPVRRRFGIVSLSRDPTAENAARKWYMFRAVRDFNTQLNAAPPVPWAWDIVMGIIKRQSQRV